LALSLKDEPTPGDIKTIASQLEITSDRALRLVSDLTRVARLDDMMFEMMPVNPYRLCGEVLFGFNGLYRQYQRRLNLRCSGKSKLVVANQELLSSVVYNFCDNALHYSSTSTVSELFIRAVKNEKVRIGVRDFGPCLPVSIWRGIRQGGLKSPQSINMRPQSSGLGLYISSKFIRAMNGEFGAVRHRDGTTLYVDLPLSKQLSLL
jgi:signal transduction histidine kinase